MARTIKTISAPRLADLVVNGVTTKGIVSLVNDYLATLVAPTVRAWSLDISWPDKRQHLQWNFTVVSDSGGAALATPFTLLVNQAQKLTDLETAIQTYYTANAATTFIAGPRLTEIDKDDTVLTKQWIAGHLVNATPGASANYSLIA
jgi:hypothetical protein